MISSRKNPKKMFSELRNKNLELHAYAEGSENLRKRALGALSYNVKKKNFYKKHTLEPIEIIKEVPVEVIKEIEVVKEVEVKVPYEVVKEVPVEVPVEIIKEVEVEVPVEVIKEVIKEVEVDREVIKEVPVEVEKEVIKEIEVIKEVPVDVVREVEVIVEKEVLVPVDKLMLTMNKLKDEYDTRLKLEKLSKKAMEKRFKAALAQANMKKPEKIVSIEPDKKWISTYIYILTMFSLTQILQWILL